MENREILDCGSCKARGWIAAVSDGILHIERCDSCERYGSDEIACSMAASQGFEIIEGRLRNTRIDRFVSYWRR